MNWATTPCTIPAMVEKEEKRLSAEYDKVMRIQIPQVCEELTELHDKESNEAPSLRTSLTGSPESNTSSSLIKCCSRESCTKVITVRKRMSYEEVTSDTSGLGSMHSSGDDDETSFGLHL